MVALRSDPAAHPQAPLPAGQQFALTWSIPDNYGGMTAALLHRSRAFVRLGGSPVDVLTFDARPDYPAVERDLRERGELVDGMRLLNLWDWFRDHGLPQDAPGTLDLDRHPFEPLGDHPEHVSAWRDRRELSRARLVDGATVQVDHYREDGSLLACDVRGRDGRTVVLCDSSGTPVRSWGSAWGFYRFWLDLLRGREQSFFVVDSKTVARFMATYRRKNAVVVHVVHGAHLSGDRLSASRRDTFERLDAYDSVVLLTRAQRRDVEGLLGARDNLAVIPNGCDLPPAGAMEARDPAAGIMLASLTARKRVDHAVRAVSLAAAQHPEVTLDVYGDGAELERIVATVAELDAPVRMRGHVPGAKDLLDSASFLLLTSASEGLPLVLVEAMAAGCIPIAYDIKYGPADVIRDGYNGFIVPAGRPDAVAGAITRLLDLTPRQVARLRRHARRAARQFSDLAVTRQWSTQLRDAAARRSATWAQEHRRAG